MDFEIIVVSYHSRPQVERLLAGLAAAVPVAIVDNAGGADRVHELACEGVRRCVDGGGQGFAKAANLGARTSTHDYVVFVNPDARPSLPDLQRLVDHVRSDRSVASAAAATVGTNGRFELGNGGWEPTVPRALAHAVGLHKLFPGTGLWYSPRPGETRAVDWTSGACLAVERRRFLALGGFDESFFVYNEDVGFGRRVRAAGLRQDLLTDVVVQHAGGGSGAPSLRMLQQRGASMAAYTSAHLRPISALTLRLVLTAGYAGRVVLALLLRRGAVAAEHRAYLRGLWRGAPSWEEKRPPADVPAPTALVGITEEPTSP